MMDTMSYEDGNAEMDFDIQYFVSSYDSLRKQLDEYSAVLRATDSLRRWEVPSLTFLCCIFVVTLCISFPELLLAFCLSPIPVVLLVTGIKNVGQKKKIDIRHIVVMAVETEEEKLNRKKEVIEKTTKDLRRFIKIICELQHWMKEAHRKLDFLQRLFSWDDPQLTLRFMGCTFAVMLSLILVPLSLIMLTGFMVIFFKNEDFKKVLFEYLVLLKVYVPHDDTVHGENEDEWFDASGTAETDNSSYDEDESSGSDFEDIVTSHKSANHDSEKRSRSFVSHISEYRKRRQELNKGNCAACDVAFSSLLTRRKYCRRCGDKFCSKCCRQYVKKAALGATAPGSWEQRVLVCTDCYGKLRAKKVPD